MASFDRTLNDHIQFRWKEPTAIDSCNVFPVLGTGELARFKNKGRRDPLKPSIEIHTSRISWLACIDSGRSVYALMSVSARGRSWSVGVYIEDMACTSGRNQIIVCWGIELYDELHVSSKHTTVHPMAVVRDGLCCSFAFNWPHACISPHVPWGLKGVYI